MRDVPCPECGRPVREIVRIGDAIETTVHEDGTPRRRRVITRAFVWHVAEEGVEPAMACIVPDFDELVVLMRRATFTVVA